MAARLSQRTSAARLSKRGRRYSRKSRHASVLLRVRVMTFNIHHGEGTDGRYDLKRIASVIASAKPDIVALQETERFRQRTGRDDQPAELAHLLGMNHVFANVRDHRHDDNHHAAGYGNAILTRFPIVAHEHFDISFSGSREPRGCLHATVSVDGSPLHVFCVHLGLRTRERHYQMEQLLSDRIVAHDKYGSGPKVLLGDFNNWWPVKSARMVDQLFRNACVVTGRRRLRTFGKRVSFLCLDYIFTSHDIDIADCTVVKTPLARVASDHRPLVCALSLPVMATGKAAADGKPLPAAAGGVQRRAAVPAPRRRGRFNPLRLLRGRRT